jgi:tropomyosin-1
MTANVQGSNILDVLKKKMRATKEECEKYKEDCEDLQRKLQVEIMRREEVRYRKDDHNFLRT